MKKVLTALLSVTVILSLVLCLSGCSVNEKHTIFMDFTPSFFFSSSFYRTCLPNTTMSTGRPRNM